MSCTVNTVVHGLDNHSGIIVETFKKKVVWQYDGNVTLLCKMGMI